MPRPEISRTLGAPKPKRFRYVANAQDADEIAELTERGIEAAMGLTDPTDRAAALRKVQEDFESLRLCQRARQKERFQNTKGRRGKTGGAPPKGRKVIP